ncbi:dipeptidase [Homoserinibacter sp. GY 40078]|uniref:dipeptidase n=1 Tax=Homoserinibacter sp. GY 40078 TaxID=2603275 RepID=UPI0011C8885B|nr:dipeptidase [Homoserinibacter sp. GY 40078]TXK17673.1 dipeptidase [Homoserinibacter sp. GY 40078]
MSVAGSDSTSSATPRSEEFRTVVAAGLPRAIADISGLVRIPSVSWDGFDHSHVQASADRVAELARELGVFESVEVVQLPVSDPDSDALGLPAVVATREAKAGKPTILLYAHHDVQPPGDDAAWDSKPFEPTVRGERLYGRGAADDKAGVALHLAAIRAHLEVLGDPEIGLVLYAEGEEEFGSRSILTFLDHYRETFDADVIVVADSGNWTTEIPAITVGLRGAVAFNLRITTLDHASHSGMFGGPVPDAMLAAIRTLDTLWNPDGSVAVEGLDSREAETPDYDEAQLRLETGLLPEVAPIGRGEIVSRMWNQPAITITGIDAPSVREASNTLVPSVRVRVSARVAPGQRAEDAYAAIMAHLERNAAYGARLEVDGLDLGQPFLVDTSGWAVADAREVLEEAFGAPAVEMGVGGSIPFIAELAERFPRAQILVTGVEDPDSRAHSPNESLHIPSLERAILAEALLLSRLGARTPAS